MGARQYEQSTRLGEDEDEFEKEKISVSSSSLDTTTPQQKRGGDDRCQRAGADGLRIRYRKRRHRHGGGFPQPTCTPAWSRWQRSGPRKWMCVCVCLALHSARLLRPTFAGVEIRKSRPPGRLEGPRTYLLHSAVVLRRPSFGGSPVPS